VKKKFAMSRKVFEMHQAHPSKTSVRGYQGGREGTCTPRSSGLRVATNWLLLTFSIEEAPLLTWSSRGRGSSRRLDGAASRGGKTLGLEGRNEMDSASWRKLKPPLGEYWTRQRRRPSKGKKRKEKGNDDQVWAVPQGGRTELV